MFAPPGSSAGVSLGAGVVVGRPRSSCCRPLQQRRRRCRAAAARCASSSSSSTHSSSTTTRPLRFHKVVHGAEWRWLFGAPAPSSAASPLQPAATAAAAAAAVPVSQQQHHQQLSHDIAGAESWLELLELLEQHQDHLQLHHWLRALFRLCVQLHEAGVSSRDWPDLGLDARLDALLAAAAAQLMLLLPTSALPASSSNGSSSSTAPQPANLPSQLADLVFALATCGAAAADDHGLHAEGHPAAAGPDAGVSMPPSPPAVWWCVGSGAAAVLDAAAAVGCSSSGGAWSWAGVDRKDAVSLLWGFGHLKQLQQRHRHSSSRSSGGSAARQQPDHDAFVAALCRHIAHDIQRSNNTTHAGGSSSSSSSSSSTATQPQPQQAAGGAPTEPWHPEDLADAAAGLAAAGHASPAAASLLDAAAHEAYRQLSNRHSAAGAFTVDALLALLSAYSHLGYRDGHALRMFDAAATWVVKRVRARHMQAPSSPTQLAALAATYAALQHRSVVVPELLHALSAQACKAAATAVELAAADPHAFQDPAGSSYCQWTPSTAASFLRSHLLLGYRPPELLVVSLMPALHLHLQQQQQQQLEQRHGEQQQQQAAAIDLMAVLAELQQPQAQGREGQQPVMSALEAAAWRGSSSLTDQHQDDADVQAVQLASLLYSTAALGATPPAPAQLEAVADSVVLAVASKGLSSSSSSSSRRGARLGVSEAVRVLWALGQLGALDLPRFGWLLKALGEAPGSSRLNEAQLAAVCAAQASLGRDGAEMAAEVLPAALAACINEQQPEGQQLQA